MELCWHRRDLRTVDASVLAGATTDGSVIPVYVVDPAVEPELGTRQRAFVGHTLQALRDRYRALGSDLLVRHGPAADVLEELVTTHDAETVHYAGAYSPARRDQQRRVDERLETTRYVDTVLVDPTVLEAKYPSYSQFYRDWQRVEKPEPRTEPDATSLAALEDETPIPFLDHDGALHLPDAGQVAARDRLDAFCANGIRTYAATRDDLSNAVEQPTQAVSRLSPALAVGALGIRTVWRRVARLYAETDGDTRRNVEKFGSELAWREWAYHQLQYNPDLATTNYKSLPGEIAWRNDGDDLEAWKRGETGYPLVDAGMRQLEAEGYVHNRPRQVVASFLTKHLLVDWRLGERHFREQLLDYDPATNPASWQWIASTGTDSVDVRIFDPVSQLAKYDPEGTFVRAYVPELTDVHADKLVDWPTLSSDVRNELAPAYPAPIVDRGDAYARAQRVFERALGKR
ncbi:cryptochrome/photolyase family protein [Natrialbaceae archaeon A-chndr2]